MSLARTAVLLLALMPLSLAAAAVARADIPSDYKGQPYKGTPSAIPGRVELANLDTGGFNVSYNADHNRMNSAGYQPISGNDYRPDEMDLPNICKTNTQNMDKWATDGGAYPSETDRYWYYMGYAHAQDWVKLTVNVQQAGMYTVSSYWASEGADIGLSIWFNDGHSAVDAIRPKDGVNKTGMVMLPGTSDYHIWKDYPKFATVELTAGLQVMTFHLEKHDHLQYGFLQFDLVGGGSIDAGGVADASLTGPGAGGSGNSGGGAAGTATVGAAGASGANGTAGGNTGGSGNTAGIDSAAKSDAPTGADAGCSCRTGRTANGGWATRAATAWLVATGLRRRRRERAAGLTRRTGSRRSL